MTTEVPAEDLLDDIDGFEWVRRPEAVARLGVSERTVDNRIASGKLRKRQSPEGYVEILVPKATEDDRTEKALFLVERFNTQLTAQVQPLIDRVESLARENGELRARNSQLETELESLRKNHPKPWWQRIFG